MSLETRLAALITAIGADIKALQAAGGGAVSIIDELRGGASLKDDFATAVTVFGQSVSGTGAAITFPTAPPDDTAIGVATLNTGSSSFGYCAFKSAFDAFLLGRGRARFVTRVRFPTLSVSGERYNTVFGFGDSESFPTDAVQFAYEEVGSANWRCKTTNNFSTTTVETSIPVLANTWYTLAIEVNAAGTSADFFINGTLVATIATNIPTASGRTTGVVVGIAKNQGGSARTCLVDFIAWEVKRTTLR